METENKATEYVWSDKTKEVCGECYKLVRKYAEKVPPAGSMEQDAFWKAFNEEWVALSKKHGIDNREDPVAFHAWESIADALNDIGKKKSGLPV